MSASASSVLSRKLRKSPTVAIEARRSDGFDTKTLRVVRENASTLKFQLAEFEEE